MISATSWFAWRSVTLSVLAFLAAADTGKPTLEDFRISTDGQNVGVSVRLENAFDELTLERLNSGLPTELTYRFRLFKDRKRWLDNAVDRTSYQVIVMYNAVSREYLVNYKLDGKLTETRVVRDLEELERAMSVLEHVQVFTLGRIKPETQILVRARVELGSGTWLFIFPTTRTTPWVRSRKLRPAEGN